MKVVQLTAENFKRLVAVDISPTSDTVVIAGRNGQGKTSVLDAIWGALDAAALRKTTPRPVRDGADKSTVTVDLGDVTVTRRFKPDGSSTLIVENADGARPKSPQKLLDDLVGRLSFDPLAFTQLKASEQRQVLLDLTGFDPAPIDHAIRAKYEERTDVGRRVRQLEGQIAGMAAPDPNTPDEEVSIADLVAEHDTAIAAATAAEAHRRNCERAAGLVADLQAELEEVQTRFEAARDDLMRLQAVPAPAVPDVDEIRARMATVEQTNAAVRAAVVRRKAVEDLNDERALQEALTADLADLEAAKQAALAEAAMPIPELGVDDTGVTYRGVPFSQCSAAEQLRVSMAMAMAGNPTLRVILIRDGSLLDRDNMALVTEMAAAHDFQVWVERVDESGGSGVVIEDGHVVTPMTAEPVGLI